MTEKYCINGISQYHALMWMNSTKFHKVYHRHLQIIANVIDKKEILEKTGKTDCNPSIKLL